MRLTILSAVYANAERTGVLLSTAELGDVVASPTGTPDIWPLVAGMVIDPYVEPDGIAQKHLTRVLQKYMDRKAHALGYDDIKTAITYRGDANPKFAAEADAFFRWRSDVWTTAYLILAAVEAGARELPTIEEAIGLLPALGLNE